jgi:peptide chain release factor
MSKFGVSLEKERALEVRMAALGLREEDIEERFIRGSGAGGQKINKTSSTVQLRHVGSGLEVRCQLRRSQSLNRYYARILLCDKYERQRKAVESSREAEVYKERRAKRGRSYGVKQQILREKKSRSEQKKLRQKVCDN